jgi:hypothetical protein
MGLFGNRHHKIAIVEKFMFPIKLEIYGYPMPNFRRKELQTWEWEVVFIRFFSLIKPIELPLNASQRPVPAPKPPFLAKPSVESSRLLVKSTFDGSWVNLITASLFSFTGTKDSKGKLSQNNFSG